MPQSHKMFLLLFLLLLMLTRTLFQGELFRTHDMEYHAARVANYYLAIKQGQIPPRWAPNLNYGMGYPVFLFIYPLPYIIPTFLYAAGLSVEWSINLTMIGSIWAGTFGMFVLAKELLKKSKYASIGAFFATLLYTLAPYTLLNIFVRGALGETLFFGIFPWVLYLFSLNEPKRSRFFIPLTACVVALFLLSHQLSVMIAVPLIALYAYLQHTRTGKSSFIPPFISTLLGVLLSAWFWIPFLAEKGWTIVNQQSSVIQYWKEFPRLHELFWSPWAYGGFSPGVMNESFTKMIGIAQLAIVVISCFFIYKHAEYRTKRLVCWIAVFCCTFFLMLPYSRPIWELLPFLQYLQFPWRLLWVTTFCSSLILIEIIHKTTRLTLLHKITGGVIFSISMIILFSWAKPVASFKNTNHFWLEYPFTASAYAEHLPTWMNKSIKNQTFEKIIVRKQGATLFQDGSDVPLNIGTIFLKNWNGTRMSYTVELPEAGEIIQKTAYFPGWEANIDGVATQIRYTDEEFPGRIILPVSQGKHDVEVAFTSNTPARKIGSVVTAIGIVGFLVAVLQSIRGRKFLFK